VRVEGGGKARLRIREIVSAKDPGFSAAYGLLRRAFPRSELLPRREWVQLLKERELDLWTDINWHLLVAERDGAVLGAASGSYIGSLNVGMIGYIAVSVNARAQGLGPRLRKRLRKAFERDAERVCGQPLKAIVGEVHADNPWLRNLVRHENALALDFDYYQPSLRIERNPVPMILYYQPLGKPRKWLTTVELKRMLYAMWRRPYRISRPLARPAFRRMMRQLEGRRRIGSRDLTNIDRRQPKRRAMDR
jgi:hypothetical protein